MRIEKQLLNALENNHSCIWIKTIEEADFMKNLLKFLTRQYSCNDFYAWSLATGTWKIDLTQKCEDRIEMPNPSPDAVFGKMREAIENGKRAGAVKRNEIYVFKDLHLVIDKPNVIRGIRDTYENFRGKSNCYAPMIVISPIVNIPEELEHLFTVLEYDTPTKTEIKTLITATSARFAEKGLVPLTPKEINNLTNAFRGFTFKDIKSIISESIKSKKTIDINMILQRKVDLIKKTDILSYKIPQNSLKDVGGNDTFKQWVEELEVCMSPEAKEFGIKEPKGYLALGIPGQFIA